MIAGLVQGIFFRANTRYEAEALDIKGWVRNCRDGRVGATFEGEKSKVDRMIGWCHNGPPGAVVKDVEVVWQDYQGEFDSFSIR